MLQQIMRHLDTLFEELLDFECYFFLERRNCKEPLAKLVQSEVECEKSLVKIMLHLSELTRQAVGGCPAQGRRGRDQRQRALPQ